jgi:hypothetical protein
MNQQPPAQKPITYFIVTPDVFQAVANKLSTLPYQVVAGLMQVFAGTSRSMFDAPPAAPGAPRPPVPNGDQVTKPNGNGSESLGAAELAALKHVKARPGFTALLVQDPREHIAQEYDASNDVWWIADADVIDTSKEGGAE